MDGDGCIWAGRKWAAASSSGREKLVFFASKNVGFCLKKPDFDAKSHEMQTPPEPWKTLTCMLITLVL